MQVYFRANYDNYQEHAVCGNYFDTVTQRTELTPGETVICRYSALPFNLELERDLHNLKCKPINTHSQHSYIADMSWVYDLEHLTFPTWFDPQYAPEGEYVVKGKTNSKKFQWNTHMYAPTKRDAINIMCELNNDPLIGTQGVVFRKYVPLKTYEVGINGMPMTNEWRCFFYKNELITYGYYWDTLDNTALIDESHFIEHGLRLATVAANIVFEETNFFAIDVAEDQTGKWWVVEVNDGQMSGLNTIDPQDFYYSLHKVLSKNVKHES